MPSCRTMPAGHPNKGCEISGIDFQKIVRDVHGRQRFVQRFVTIDAVAAFQIPLLFDQFCLGRQYLYLQFVLRNFHRIGAFRRFEEAVFLGFVDDIFEHLLVVFRAVIHLQVADHTPVRLLGHLQCRLRSQKVAAKMLFACVSPLRADLCTPFGRFPVAGLANGGRQFRDVVVGGFRLRYHFRNLRCPIQESGRKHRQYHQGTPQPTCGFVRAGIARAAIVGRLPPLVTHCCADSDSLDPLQNKCTYVQYLDGWIRVRVPVRPAFETFDCDRA
mmetsp:Transcript_28736/g.81039  ORF Transcript_28736/g.81039 Transcript_28736/m.81039 type:complete len:273 (-) Transcript_28736:24-842(-)